MVCCTSQRFEEQKGGTVTEDQTHPIPDNTPNEAELRDAIEPFFKDSREQTWEEWKPWRTKARRCANVAVVIMLIGFYLAIISDILGWRVTTGASGWELAGEVARYAGMIALIHFPLAIPIRLAFKPYPTDTLKGFFKCLGKDIVGVVALAAIVLISAYIIVFATYALGGMGLVAMSPYLASFMILGGLAVSVPAYMLTSRLLYDAATAMALAVIRR